jgi:hypothetical protein
LILNEKEQKDLAGKKIVEKIPRDVNNLLSRTYLLEIKLLIKICGKVYFLCHICFCRGLGITIILLYKRRYTDI